MLRILLLQVSLSLALLQPLVARADEHPVPKEHPRLFGPRARLVELARTRADAYRRTQAVARNAGADAWARVVSLALTACVESDATLGRQAIDLVLPTIDGPIRVGHETFAHDLARAAVAYDLCHPWWTDAERARFHTYVDRTVDGNTGSETHVFHNGWYGYKHWGIGLAAYAGMHENPRAGAHLAALWKDYRERAAPALELAGDGGSWAEGYYVHYWLYEWLVFCEAARFCEGIDAYAAAPRFYRQRALASLFETYPALSDYGSRRPAPMGDGGGRAFGGDRDKVVAARRILCGRWRDDPTHQAVHAFDERLPRTSVGDYAYKDLLWHDPTIPKADFNRLPLSHLSPGPGRIAARSDWTDSATYFSFRCGDRFTAHQHLDQGHFLIFRNTELAGDGGHYDDFGSRHDVNYHLRSIAHSTLLVHDPAETWPKIRGGDVTGNDGGQHHDFPHHNGAVADPAELLRTRDRHDLADLLAFQDAGPFLYVAGDATRAYSPRKLERFVRQIVYLRPGTFVVLDLVTAREPRFAKTWLLQAARLPTGDGPRRIIDNTPGRLTLDVLLPADARIASHSGDALYRYGGQSYPPGRDTGPAPECRVEVSPHAAAREDAFLVVLTADDAGGPAAPRPEVRVKNRRAIVTIGGAKVTLSLERPCDGEVEVGGRKVKLAARVEQPR